MFHSISWMSLYTYDENGKKVFNVAKLKKGVTYIAVLGNSNNVKDVSVFKEINVLYAGPKSINTSKQHKGEAKSLRQQIVIFERCEQPQVDAPVVQKEDKTPVVITF